jgi:hypothetical protein
MMMNGVSKTLLGMTVLLVPAVSMAQRQPVTQTQPFNYSYVEIAYDELDLDRPGDADGDGLTLSGSFEINEDWHAVASYGEADLDGGIDIDTWTIGAGYRYPLRDNIDLYGRVLYVSSELDAGPFDGDEDGLGLQVRLRARMSDVFELEGGIQHFDVGDSDTSLQAGARYHFTEEFSAAIGLTFAGDTDSFGISARYSF